jgi:hypothetical protein
MVGPVFSRASGQFASGAAGGWEEFASSEWTQRLDEIREHDLGRNGHLAPDALFASDILSIRSRSGWADVTDGVAQKRVSVGQIVVALDECSRRTRLDSGSTVRRRSGISSRASVCARRGCRTGHPQVRFGQQTRHTFSVRVKGTPQSALPVECRVEFQAQNRYTVSQGFDGPKWPTSAIRAQVKDRPSAA